MLAKFDTWLLNKFEKFTQWWQRTFGQNCFWWAKFFDFVGFILLILCFIETSRFYSLKLIPLILATGLYAFGSLTFFLIFIPIYEHRITSNHTSGLANPLKVVFSDVRVMLNLYYLVMNVYVLWAGAGGYSYYWTFFLFVVGLLFFPIAVLYFVSCDPLPPCKSRVRQFADSVIEKIKEILSPPLAPIPVRVPSR